MKAVIVTIGDELIIGQVINTNAAFIAERVTEAGIEVHRVVSVGDDRDEIAGAISGALEDAEIVIVTGGLGPTHDDVTKHAVAGLFGKSLISDPGQRERISRLLASRRMEWGPVAEEQTMVPEGAGIIPNRFGTAAGLVLRRGEKTVIVLPGVPYEMEQMMKDAVVPILAGTGTDSVITHRTLRTTGISESALAARLGDIDHLPGGATLAFLPSLSGVRLRVTVRATTREEASRFLWQAAGAIAEKAGKYLFGEGGDELEDVVGRLLAERKLTIATAESCTGGLIARRLTSVPGSSSYFLGSIVAYSDRLKTRLLEIPPSLLSDHGAVSGEVARAMAENIRRIAGSDIGVASTGIAGPSGASPEKPVGLVFTGYADRDGPVTLRHTFGEGRDRVVQRATFAALETVRRRILKFV